MSEHSLFCQCPKCVTKKIQQVQDDPKVTRICEPVIELCRTCKNPNNFGDELQAICVALLDMQTTATKEQKDDHKRAIDLAKSVIRLRMRQMEHSYHND